MMHKRPISLSVFLETVIAPRFEYNWLRMFVRLICCVQKSVTRMRMNARRQSLFQLYHSNKGAGWAGLQAGQGCRRGRVAGWAG